MRVSREMTFHAKHSHRGMLYEPSHSHEFRVVLTMEGELNEEGFLVDFRVVKRLFNRVVGRELANRDLDEIFEYPTSENLAVWIWTRLAKFFPLHSVEVMEKPHSKASYFGENVASKSESRTGNRQ